MPSSGSAGADVFDSGSGPAVFHDLGAVVVEDEQVLVGFDYVASHVRQDVAMHFPPHPHGGPDWGSVAEWAGAAAEWVGAIATLLAVVGAAASVIFAARALRLSREANAITQAAYEADLKERRERQARFVYALNEVPLIWHKGDVLKWLSSMVPTTGAQGGAFVEGSFKSSNGGRVEQTVATDIISTLVTVHNRSEEIVASWRVSLFDRFTGSSVGGIAVGESADPLLPGEDRTIRLDVLQPEGFHPHIGPVLEFRDSSGQWWRRRGSDPIELLDPQS